MKKLLLYGIQRSGTNFAEELLRRRYRVAFLNDTQHRDDPRHKHARLFSDKSLVSAPDYAGAPSLPDFADFDRATGHAADACIVVSKHPLAWLVSYRRWAERHGWPDPVRHHLEDYAAFYGLWSHYAGQTDRVHFLRYEDLLKSAPVALGRLAGAVPLARRSFAALRGTRPARVPMSGRYGREKRAAYRRRAYLDALPPEEIEAAARLVPAELWQRLGYERPGEDGRQT